LLILEARILTPKANENGIAIHKKGQFETSQWSYFIYLTLDTIGGFRIIARIVFRKILTRSDKWAGKHIREQAFS
jgi:hypothetical protein